MSEQDFKEVVSKLGPIQKAKLKDGRVCLVAKQGGPYHTCNVNGSWQPLLSNKIDSYLEERSMFKVKEKADGKRTAEGV